MTRSIARRRVRNAAMLCAALSLLAVRAGAASLTSAPFGTTTRGVAVTEYTMTTDAGLSVSFIDYGGIVTNIEAPDRAGHVAPIALGFRDLRVYETVSADNEMYIGALIGRYANWIAGGMFTLDGRVYHLTLTDPPNTLHGGAKGFDKRMWDVRPVRTAGQSVSARLAYTSADGEEGFPGTLKVGVTYTLAEDGAFTIHYTATTDRDTVINLTSHIAFNLAGAGAPDGVLAQVLRIHADRYMPVDRLRIPLGPSAPVAGTPLDFRTPTAIGARIAAAFDQLAFGGNGYDTHWILNKHGDAAQPQVAVQAYDPASGRTLVCLTTQPGVQIYSGGYFDGALSGVGGRYVRQAGFTLMTQHAPDSPNHPEYPTTTLKPGQTFDSTTIFRFGVQ